MPIQLEVTRFEKGQTLTTYIIRRIAGPDVVSASVSDMIIGPDDPPPLFRFTTFKVREQASVAWPSDMKVTRLILVVERVDTDTESWGARKRQPAS